MKIRLIIPGLIVVSVLLAVAGCGLDMALSSRDAPPEDDFDVQLVKVLYRVPGVGTVKTEMFNPDSQGKWFLNFTTELKSVTYGDTVGIDVANQIFPLAVGNEWLDSLTIFNPAGDTVASVILTSNVDRDTTIGSEVWYVLVSDGKTRFLGTNRLSGFWSRDIELISGSDSIQTVGEPFASALYPTEKGTTFESSPGIVIVVTDTAVSVTVPAGTFEAVKYLKYARLAKE